MILLIEGTSQVARPLSLFQISVKGAHVIFQSAKPTGEYRKNKETVRQFVEEVLGQGHLELLPDLVADEYVAHLAIGDLYGPGGVRVEIATYRRAFPDLTVTVDELLVDGDKVVRRFTLRGTHHGAFLGVPASGRPVMLRGIAIDRLAGSRLVESWVQIDELPR